MGFCVYVLQEDFFAPAPRVFAVSYSGLVNFTFGGYFYPDNGMYRESAVVSSQSSAAEIQVRTLHRLLFVSCHRFPMFSLPSPLTFTSFVVCVHRLC